MVMANTQLCCGQPGPGRSGLKSASVRLPRLFMLVLDPAGVYFADHAPNRQGPVYREAAVFGPGVAGGSRQATEEEIRALRQQRDRPPPGEVDFQTALQSGSVTRAAVDLLESGSAVLAGPAGQVQAGIIRFWRGNSILEITAANRQTRVRIPRDVGPGNQEMLALYLGEFLSGR